MLTSQLHPASAETVPHTLDSSFEYLIVSVLKNDPNVVIVSLNRPKKRNSINAKFWKEIGNAFRQLGTLGDGCRVILLTGIGRAFCGGIDVTDTALLLEQDDETDVGRKGVSFLPKILEMQQCFTAIEECPVPVLAVIHGACIGAGVDLIAATDIRYASSQAIFSVREVRVGLAADIGTLQRLPKICGNDSLIREVCYTGRDFDAMEAQQMGLVSRVCTQDDVMQQALKTCQAIASVSPLAVSGTKASLVFSRDHSVRQGLKHVAMHNAMALQTGDLFAAAGGTPFPGMLAHSRL